MSWGVNQIEEMMQEGGCDCNIIDDGGGIFQGVDADS